MLASSLAAQAFNENGHKLVVQLAQYHLNGQARAMQVLETQLMKAGVRQAAILNETLGASASP